MSAMETRRFHGDVLLVGSLPFETAEEALRAGARELGDHVPCLPDGEFGLRKIWVGFLAATVFSSHPDLEQIQGTTGPPRQPERTRAPGERPRFDDAPLFAVRPGAELRFDDLGYGRIALESYDVFGRLREEGAIPEGVRFQVCMPGTRSAMFLPPRSTSCGAAFPRRRCSATTGATGPGAAGR